MTPESLTHPVAAEFFVQAFASIKAAASQVFAWRKIKAS
jgi:hypothetical protein